MELTVEAELSTAARKTVAVERCDGYQPDGIRKALHNVLEPFGGMKAIVKPRQRVLLKPNLLSAKAPPRAITTHPNLVEAVINEVRKAGGEPFIGDSPGGAVRGIKRVWQNTGMEEMAGRANVELVNFEASGSKGIRFGRYSFFISKPVLEADIIINLPKLKTHTLTLFTCAIKNMFGVIPGFRKGELHKLFPGPVEFAEMLVHLYKLVTPSFTIVDAIQAMEGNGPSSGSPHDLGLILAGDDAVAIDSIAAGIIGFPEGAIDTTRIAAGMGLGQGGVERLNVVGSGVGVRPDRFKLPSNRGLRLLPRPLARMVAPFVWVRPRIDPARCTGCGFCAESCPVEAISKDGPVYVIDHKKCVTCLCCHELCPESSIDITMSRLARFFT